ncbi:MAG: AtpZ/AtpI family protein [Oscillospiraceae bacterium]|nr:AtpZ/AtpI family protein [Oscillospiraceae bacterium]
MNNKNPLKAYLIAGHLAWLIVTPLLLFIGGGSWLVERFGWDDRLKLVFVLLGLIVMIAGVVSYSVKLVHMYYGKDNDKDRLKLDRRDYDYYDDNYK